jgi:hypothetical protein
MGEVTWILGQIDQGDPHAAEKLCAFRMPQLIDQ